MNESRRKRLPRRAGLRRLACIVIFLAFCAFSPGAAAERVGGEPEWGTVAEPLRIVNLHPFHLLYGMPGSFGARLLSPGSTELLLSTDVASYLVGEKSGSEEILIDGETYRLSLTLRGGFRKRWEWFLEAPLIMHRGGVFDSFIENWHDFFGLPQSGRDEAPRDRLILFFRDGAETRFDIRENAFSFGDISLGVGYAPVRKFFTNDGPPTRAAGSTPLPWGRFSRRRRAICRVLIVKLSRSAASASPGGPCRVSP